MYSDNLQPITLLGQISTDGQATRREMLELALERDPAVRVTIKARIAKLESLINANWKKYSATDMHGREKLRADFEEAWGQWYHLRYNRLIPLIDAGRVADFLALRNKLAIPLINRTAADLDGLVAFEDKSAAQARADSEAAYRSTQILIIALVLASLALAIGLAGGIGRMISRPLGRTVQVLEGLAEGRLDMQLDVDTKDEVGQMATALNRAMDRLSEALTAIGSNAQQLADSAEELPAVSLEMRGAAKGSASQAALMAESAERVSTKARTVAFSTEQMSGSIQEIT